MAAPWQADYKAVSHLSNGADGADGSPGPPHFSRGGSHARHSRLQQHHG